MVNVDEVIVSKLESARKELLDLGLRNPLLNYRLSKARGLEIVDELPMEVYSILIEQGRKMSFLPAREDENSDSIGQPEEDFPEGPLSRHTDTRLQTDVSSEELQSRLLKTFYWANSYLQDHGANILFIALGMLKWYEADSSDTPRYAPLILIPIKLERASVRDRFQLSYTGEDVGSNLSLIEKVRVEFGAEIPDLPDDGEDLDLEAYFAGIGSAIESLPRWEIDTERIVLGFFSFSKFLMYRDLDANNWPDDAKPSEHPIIQSLLHSGFDEPGPSIGDEEHLDDYLTPEQVHHVVDADSSQILTINDVINGRNLVIQGPPGTGKSQTITNIIAEAIGQGKTVMFVSEKMAALEVVKRRLDSVGLGDACLELHSHKTTKRAVLDEIERTLDLGKPVLGLIEDDFDELKRLQQRLNAYSEAVNTPVGNTSVTPIQAFGELNQLRTSSEEVQLPKLDIPDIELWDRGRYREKQTIVEELQTRVSSIGVPNRHAFWGISLKVLLPSDQERLKDLISASQESLNTFTRAANELANRLSISTPTDLVESDEIINVANRVTAAPDLEDIQVQSSAWYEQASDIETVVSSGKANAGINQEYGQSVIQDAWGQDLLTTRQTLSSKGRGAFRFLSGEYRRAKNHLAGLCTAGLPSGIEAQIRLVDAIMESQRHRATLEQHRALAQDLFGRRWQGEASEWEALEAVTDYMTAVHDDASNGTILQEVISVLGSSPSYEDLKANTASAESAKTAHIENSNVLQKALGLDAAKRFDREGNLADQPFIVQEDALEQWSQAMDDIHQMTGYNVAADVCRREDLASVVALAESWEHGGLLLTDTLKQVWLEQIIQQAFKEREALTSFDGNSHRRQIEKFQEIDKLVIEHNRTRLAVQHWQKLPHQQDAGGQIGILRREFQKKRRHLPIQQLMSKAGSAIQAIKPIFMMSPLSIASYIPAGSLNFDMVIFDEASQVKPVDALGAIMRSNQAVVVGDNQQLPPTNFFASVSQSDDDDDEESATSDMESILGLFIAQNAPVRMLRWHYRSLHESLIAVSNKEFYQNKLVIFPSPDSEKQELGLIFHHIRDAIYDRGASKTNRIEAEAVASAVMEHAKSRADLSLGVAAFSTAQMNAIQDQIEYLRRRDSSNEGFFAAHPYEPFFVKNLENVQGDERDVIFISVGYGRDSSGRVRMNFGPLTSEGGHRRLNVLITRAKRRCEVFSGITADDIDAGNSRYRGVPALKTFLSYAEKGIIELPEESGREVDSPFQDSVAAELQSLGYDVRQEVGTAGYFIDLAIVDPERQGRYLIGIECDGASYHSSRSARDRDRLREQVLRSRDWQIHRIWSTDWFRNPHRELSKAVEAIEAAKVHRPIEESAKSNPTAIIRDEDVSRLAEANQVDPYAIAQLDIFIGDMDLHTVSRRRLADWITRVVEVESPVHMSEAFRRIANAVGVRRVASRIQEAMEAGAEVAARDQKVRIEGEFLWRTDMDIPAIRDRSELPAASRKFELIAPEEIAISVQQVVVNSYGIDRIDVPQIVSRVFGFKRATEDIRVVIDGVVANMLADGLINNDGNGHLSIA